MILKKNTIKSKKVESKRRVNDETKKVYHEYLFKAVYTINLDVYVKNKKGEVAQHISVNKEETHSPIGSSSTYEAAKEKGQESLPESIVNSYHIVFLNIM